MRLEPPAWWYGDRPSDRLIAALLQPAGYLYAAAAKARFVIAKPYRSSLPVVCIGNLTLGGAGKTPLALAVAQLLCAAGHQPAFLTRGYGGQLLGPHRVDPAKDSAVDVGDEALLLARVAPVILARNRPKGAQAIEAMGRTVIVMDDGFQNPSVEKDLALIAVDAAAGVGNGRVFPAGPLRAPLPFQMARAHAMILIGARKAESIVPKGFIPVIEARLAPSSDTEWLRARRAVAFSGIGRPAKFFETLRQTGADIVSAKAFPDHHRFSEEEALGLIEDADGADALLVTTEKDWVRIPGSGGPLGALKAKARPLPVSLAFPEEEIRRLRQVLSRLSPTES